MPTIFRDRLHVNGEVYTIDADPLALYLASLLERALVRPTPFRQNGYMATWSIVDDAMYLVELTGESVACLFAHRTSAVQAVWFSDVIRGWRGDRCDNGYPPRTFFDAEIVLEVASGMVTRRWLLELRAVAGQSHEEPRLSLPRFLWPARLGND
jgi:hypothetical protein